MFRKGDQTPKLDVWSLFVTMLWMLDVGDFVGSRINLDSLRMPKRAVLFAASNVDTVSKIREMAIINPKERGSAAQMLVKYYDGVDSVLYGIRFQLSQAAFLPQSPPPEPRPQLFPC